MKNYDTALPAQVDEVLTGNRNIVHITAVDPELTPPSGYYSFWVANKGYAVGDLGTMVLKETPDGFSWTFHKRQT